MFNRLLQTARQTRKPLVLSFFLSSFTLLSGASFAQNDVLKTTQTPGQQVHFSISESQEVPNDRLNIVFQHLAQGNSARLVINEINEKMQAALEALEKYPDVKSQTSQYQTHPAYNRQKVITHWTGSQSLTLTLENKPESIQVLTEMQSYLTYQSMQFSVSEALKDEIMQGLTVQAIQNFRKQATLIAQAFNAPGHRIVETHINRPYNSPISRGYTANRMMAADSMAPPAISVGESTLKVDISGILELTQ